MTIEDSNHAEGSNQTSGPTPPVVASEQKCSYCGRPLDPQNSSCTGCSAPRIPPIIESFSPVTVEKAALNGRTATLILATFLAGQFGIAAVVGFIYGFGQAIAGRGDAIRHFESDPSFLAPATFLGFIGGGIAMILLSRTLLKEALADVTELGAAWVPGRRADILKGLAIGVGVAVFYVVPGTVFRPQLDENSVGPLARMAMTPGLPQIAWFTMALFLAPPLEEMLFRGVVYGGYRRSLGPIRAAWLTTAIFALLHITEAIHYPPALIAIAGMALLALRLRLRSAAIGPAIALHFGYNFVIALGVVCSTWLRSGRS